MSELQVVDDLFPSQYLKHADLHGRQVTLTVASFKRVPLANDKGEEKVKGVLVFSEQRKDLDIPVQLVLCKTNAILLTEMFGKKLPDWVGKRITIGPDHWSGKDCIRVMGSPDLAADCTCTVALPRRKPFTRKLTKTAPKAAPAAPAQRQPGEEG